MKTKKFQSITGPLWWEPTVTGARGSCWNVFFFFYLASFTAFIVRYRSWSYMLAGQLFTFLITWSQWWSISGKQSLKTHARLVKWGGEENNAYRLYFFNCFNDFNRCIDVFDEYLSHIEMKKYQRIHRIEWENSRFEMYVFWVIIGQDGRYTIQCQSSVLLTFVNSTVTSEFTAQMASNAENVPIWWRHHEFL